MQPVLVQHFVTTENAFPALQNDAIGTQWAAQQVYTAQASAPWVK